MNFKQWVITNSEKSKDMEIMKQIVKHKDFPDGDSFPTIARFLTDHYGFPSEELNVCKVVWNSWKEFMGTNSAPVKSQEQNTLINTRMKRGEASKLLICASHMPPLIHNDPLHRFDPAKSEVAKWLVQQPDIMQYVFIRAKNAGMIIYDHESGKWRGVNYAPDI